jgi:DNA-binding LacI/PurR family transcriptional regulator
VKRVSRPTQLDIAKAAGVSPAVVSLVVNGRANGKVKISEATQERVQTAIRDLGYVPNLAARQLAGGQTNVIGVFTYEPMFPMRPNSFYQPFLIGIEEQATASDYNLLLFTRYTGSDQRRIYHNGINQLLAAQGAVLLGTYENRDELTCLRNDGYPFVFVGRRAINGEAIPSTAADYAGATALLVQQLLEAGHREILYLGADLFNESAEDRERGFLNAMAGADIPHPERRIHRMDLALIDRARLRQWIAQGITALAIEKIDEAHRLLLLAEDIGLRVPGDLSIVALGKADDPTQDHHGIDTFLIPQREMGAQAVTLLDHILHEADAGLSYPITIHCIPASGHTIGPPSPSYVAGKEVP